MKNLTKVQKERLGKLEPQLKNAASSGNLTLAKRLTLDIQEILRPTGHETRLMQSKNWLYETALKVGEYDFAIEGLKGVKQKTNKNTRIHLEATAMLAIAYLRKSDLKNAEIYIAEVLKNDNVIKTALRRSEFRRLIIERFEEETILFSLKGSGNENLDIDKIQELALSQSEKSSEKEIYYLIGYSVPDNVVSSLLRIDNFAKKQLPTSERIKLPSPTETIERGELGKTLFLSIKRTLYNSFCNPESDIYKTWFNAGMQIVLTRKYITTAIVSLFVNLGIGIRALAATVIALIIKFGIEVYCNHHKPTGIMDMR
jgi:hypothetical protein